VSEKLIRQLIRESLLLEEKTSEATTEVPWDQPELFYAAGNGIGRGEYSLVAALVGATITFDSEAIDKKLTAWKDTPNKDKKAKSGALSELDAAGRSQIPESVQAGVQGPGENFDVYVDQDMINTMANDPKVTLGGSSNTEYLGKKIEVKEPGSNNTFRMASEGQQFIATSVGMGDYMTLASQINKLQRNFYKKLKDLEGETQLDLFDDAAGLGVTQVPAEIQDFMRLDGKFFSAFSNIVRGEGGTIATRLKIMHDSVLAMGEWISSPPPTDPVAELMYNAVKKYYGGLESLDNAYVLDPSLLSSQENFYEYLLSAASADFKNRPLFEVEDGVEYIAFVTSGGYKIFPTDMETLFEKGLLKLHSLSQGNRPKFKIGDMISSGGSDEAVQPQPEEVPTPEIEVPKQLELALEAARYVRKYIREALLTEALTKTDERAIETMARKEIDKKWKEHEKKIDKMFDERDKTLFRNDAFYKVIARIYQELQRAYAEDQFKYATRYTRKDIPLARFRPS